MEEQNSYFVDNKKFKRRSREGDVDKFIALRRRNAAAYLKSGDFASAIKECKNINDRELGVYEALAESARAESGFSSAVDAEEIIKQVNSLLEEKNLSRYVGLLDTLFDLFRKNYKAGIYPSEFVKRLEEHYDIEPLAKFADFIKAARRSEYDNVENIVSNGKKLRRRAKIMKWIVIAACTLVAAGCIAASFLFL